MIKQNKCLGCGRGLSKPRAKQYFCSNCQNHLNWKEKLKLLNPRARQYFVRKLIFNKIRHNQRGISQSEISEKLNLAYKTVQINVSYLEGRKRIDIKWFGSAKVCYPKRTKKKITQ